MTGHRSTDGQGWGCGHLGGVSPFRAASCTFRKWEEVSFFPCQDFQSLRPCQNVAGGRLVHRDMMPVFFVAIQ